MNLLSLFIAGILFSASPLPIPPMRLEGTAAGDFVCQYKYKMGDSDWIYVSSGGSTPAQARVRRTQDIKYLEKRAKEAGLNFEARKLFCENPWGGDGGWGD